MNHFVTKLNSKLNLELQSIDLETDNAIEKYHKSFECVTNVLNQLKAFLLRYNFYDEMEEILFFKKLKPELYKWNNHYNSKRKYILEWFYSKRCHSNPEID